MPPGEFVARLSQEGVRVIPFGGRRCRAVAHYGIERDDIMTALTAMRKVTA